MRDELSFSMACLAALLAVMGGCGGPTGPSDAAVNAWLDRGGHGRAPLAGGADAEAEPSQNTGDAVAEAEVKAIAARRIAVTIDKAEGLPDLDAGPGESDPYVILEYEGQRHRSSVVEGNLAPVWGDTFILEVVPGGILTVKLMDEDAMSSDEQFGTVSEPIPALGVGETAPMVLKFRGGEGGTLHLTLTGMARP